MAATDEQIGGNHYKAMAIQPIEFILKTIFRLWKQILSNISADIRPKTKRKTLKRLSTIAN